MDATHSVRLLSERPRGGRVVALCSGPGMAGRPEGARLAVALARRWTEGGIGVVLADGDVGRPTLHLAFGLPNGKGLADLLLVGNGWAELALDTPVPGLRLITAGGSAAPTGSEGARDRLAALCSEAPFEGGTLVFYVPLDSALAEWVTDLCTDVVVLAAEGEPVASFFAEDEDRIRAVIGAPHGQGQRPMEPVVPHRVLETTPPKSAESVREVTVPPADRGAREHAPEPRPRSATTRIEDRWAEAAALLRARREGQAQVTAPKSGSPPSAPLMDAPRAPEPPPPPPPPLPSPPVHRVEEKPVVPGDPAHGPVPPVRAREPRPAPAPKPGPPVAPKPTPPAAPKPAPAPLAPQDPLATPPIMMAEWDRFGDEEEEAFRAARRRRMIIRGLAGVGAVVVVAGSVWVWSSTRGMPPYEPRSTALPRAAVPPTRSVPDSVAAAVTDTTAPDTTAAAAVATGPDSTLAVPETRAPHQRFSWSMAALGTMDAARSTVERLRRRAPGQAFIVAPIVSDGRTLYRVLGGLAADRDGLAAIREPLGQATREQASSWLVREAPLAFALQDFDDGAGAAAWVSELARSGVPAYVLVVERDDGSVVHRVYAGAYANEAEAGVLRGLLERAGIQDAKLVERRGRIGS